MAMNRVLMRLADDEQRRLRPHLESVRLARGTSLCAVNTVARHAYFPVTGLVSIVALTREGNSLEVAAIGREGIVGLPHMLHAAPAPYASTVQLNGEAYRLRADLFVSEFGRAAGLHDGVLHALRELVVQISQSAVCHRFHSVTQRLARSLLTSRDGTDADTLELTQEVLALRLGAARTGISVAAARLQDRGLIRIRHGRIRILNRPALERASCECYHIVKSQIGHGQSRSASGRLTRR